MVYVDPNELGVMPYARSWLDEAVREGLFSAEHAALIHDMFLMVPDGLDFIKQKCAVGIHQVLFLLSYINYIF